jgi:hypothetical protein
VRSLGIYGQRLLRRRDRQLAHHRNRRSKLRRRPKREGGSRLRKTIRWDETPNRGQGIINLAASGNARVRRGYAADLLALDFKKRRKGLAMMLQWLRRREEARRLAQADAEALIPRLWRASPAANAAPAIAPAPMATTISPAVAPASAPSHQVEVAAGAADHAFRQRRDRHGGSGRRSRREREPRQTESKCDFRHEENPFAGERHPGQSPRASFVATAGAESKFPQAGRTPTHWQRVALIVARTDS